MKREVSNSETMQDFSDDEMEVGEVNESEFGILTYYTRTRGLGGKLRVTPEDFVVRERSIYPSMSNAGCFCVAKVTLRNWETNRFVRIASRYLGISRKAVGFAGTKDKRAVTTQLFSFKSCPEEVGRLSALKDVKIEDVYRVDRGIEIGELLGNDFEINIREVPLLTKGSVFGIEGKREVEDIVNETTEELRKINGFPNFFGVQRFGAVRPVTHIVGKYIVEGDYKKAVKAYVGNPHPSEPQDTREARNFFETTEDVESALKLYPNRLVFERSMLEYLYRNKDDYVGALSQLPFNLMLMFVHSYQSYLFNLILSERIKRGLPLNEPVIGDYVLPIDKNNLPDHDKWIEVTESNIDKISIRTKEKKAYVSAIVFGSESENAFAKGEMGEIERKVIEREGLNSKDFIIREIPRLSTKGNRREVLAPLENLECKVYDDRVSLKFSLLKGEYATSLLREYMKVGVMNY